MYTQWTLGDSLSSDAIETVDVIVGLGICCTFTVHSNSGFSKQLNRYYGCPYDTIMYTPLGFRTLYIYDIVFPAFIVEFYPH